MLTIYIVLYYLLLIDTKRLNNVKKIDGTFDQAISYTPQSRLQQQSDLGLHCLPGPVLSKY